MRAHVAQRSSRDAGQDERQAKSRHALRPSAGAGAGEKDCRLGDHGQADSGLLTRDHRTVTVALRAAGQVRCVGAGPGLRQRQRDDLLAARGRRQPALLDLFAAGRADDLAREPRELDPVGGAEIPARDLFHRQTEGHVVGVLAAVGGRHAQAEQTELAHLAPHFPRKLARPVPLARQRRELLLRKRPERPDQLFLLGTEREIHDLPDAYGAWKTGLRFSAKARSPSAASAVRMCAATSESSSSSPPARSASNARLTRALTVRAAEPLPAASTAAVSSTTASRVPAGATRLTSPHSSAFAADSQPPSSIISFARRAPISLGRRWLPPPPATRPKLACWSPRRAVSSATTRSATRVSSSPPARARPWTPATTGTGSASMRLKTRCQSRMKRAHFSGSGESSRTALRSAPAQKARPAAVSVTARSAGSASITAQRRSRSS